MRVRTVFWSVAFTCAAFLKVSVPDSPPSCLGQGIAARQQEKPGKFSTSNRWLDDAERVLLGPSPVQQRLVLLDALSRLHTRECAELRYRYRELLLAWASWRDSHPAAASERAP